jgi:hypothetical protein
MKFKGFPKFGKVFNQLDTVMGNPSHLNSSIPEKRAAAEARFGVKAQAQEEPPVNDGPNTVGTVVSAFSNLVTNIEQAGRELDNAMGNPSHLDSSIDTKREAAEEWLEPVVEVVKEEMAEAFIDEVEIFLQQVEVVADTEPLLKQNQEEVVIVIKQDAENLAEASEEKNVNIGLDTEPKGERDSIIPANEKPIKAGDITSLAMEGLYCRLTVNTETQETSNVRFYSSGSVNQEADRLPMGSSSDEDPAC